MKLTPYIYIVTCLALASCSSGKQGTDAHGKGEPTRREIDECAGAKQLAEAREACLAGHYDAARDSILALRRDHKLAINARKQGILLLDSIEMFAALDTLAILESNPLSTREYVDEHERIYIKAKFFERKLEEDKKK